MTIERLVSELMKQYNHQHGKHTIDLAVTTADGETIQLVQNGQPCAVGNGHEIGQTVRLDSEMVG